MPTQVYKAKGQRVPSVTTISGRFGDKGGLIFWANAVGLGERDCDDQDPCELCGRRPGKKQYEAARKAAEVGDLGHALIEAKVKGLEIEWSKYAHLDPEQRELAQDCMDAFDRWWSGSKVDVMETELPLTSDEHLFGGTLDGCGFVGGRFSLIDWKTSRGIYADYLVQLAGYVILLEENGFPKVEDIHILRVAKETAAFEHRSFPRKSFQPALDFFLASRTLYDTDKAVAKLLK